MNRIVWNDEFEVWLDKLERPFHFKSPFDRDEFALLLVVNDSTITDEERETLATEIVKKGCRYAVCAGHQATLWDETIAMAYVCVDQSANLLEDHVVMTTSYEGEKMEDIVPHFRRMTTFDDFDSAKYMVLFLGNHETLEKQTIKLIQKQFVA